MSSTPRSKRRGWLSLNLAPFAVFALAVGCSGTQGPSTDGAALVAVHGANPDSAVRIDGAERGTVERTNGAYLVAAGDRRLEIVTPGHLPVWLDLRVLAGETYDVSVQLWPCFSELDERCRESGPSLLEAVPSPTE